MPKRFRRQQKISAKQTLFAIGASAVLAAGAGLGAVTQGMIGGKVATVASYGVRLDNLNYTEKDLRLALEQGAAGGGDLHHIALAARLRVGESAVADIPLANTGQAAANMLARFTAPGAMYDLGGFWQTATRSTTPGESNGPVPAPLTGTTAQSSDTLPAVLGPAGIAGIGPQVSPGVPTTSSPGLPNSSPQNAGGFAASNTAPTGSEAVASQNVAATATNSQPTGAVNPTANSVNTSATNTQPGGAPAPSAQGASATATGSKPTGLPDPTAYDADGALTNTGPTGSVTVTGQPDDATATNSQPAGSTTITGQSLNGTATNSAPTGSPSITPQGANSTATTSQPSGSASPAANTVDTTLTNSAPTGSASIAAQTANGTSTNTAPSGTPAISAQAADGTSTTTAPSGSPTVSARTADATLTNTAPSGTPSTAAQAANGTSTNSAPSGTPSITAQSANGTSTNSAPSGTPSITAQSANSTSTNTAPTNTAVVVAQTANGTMVNTAPTGLSATSFSVNVNGTATQPAGASGTGGSSTWYPGTLSIDTNGDGFGDTVNYTFVDLTSNGTVDLLEISSDDSTFNEGTTLTNGQTGANDDESRSSVVSGTAAYDIVVGVFTFTFSWADATSGGQATLTVASKTWFTGSFTIDADADGAADDAVNFAIADNDVNGLFDRLHLSTDDTTFAEGATSNSITGTNDDEVLTIPANVRLGSHYTFAVAFDGNPANDTSDAALTSMTWFTAALTLDTDGDGAADDTVNMALSDIDSDGLYDTVDISNDDTSYGDGSLGDGATGAGDDERVTLSDDVRLGAHYTFTVSMDTNPPADSSDVTITSKTWFTGSFTVDWDANGTADNAVNFALTDANSNGLYDNLDLSTDDSSFGEGTTLTDGITGNNDDERLTTAGDVRLGAFYTFTMAFDSNPAADSSDARATAKTWFSGSLTVDSDANGTADNAVNFALTDSNSNGVYDNLDLSTDDATFGEGTTLTNAITGSNDDERLTSSTDVRLGSFYTFTAAFDGNPPNDSSDATLTAKTWFTGTFTIDLDADGLADDPFNFALTDADSNGLFDNLDVSTDNTTYGQGGALGNGLAGVGDDERMTATSNVRYGDYFTFSTAFDNNPSADSSDVSITARTWFTGSFTIDSDGDGAADDSAAFALTDANSNGVFDTLDLSTDDGTFGEGSTLANGITGSDDERLSGTADVRLGTHYTFTAAFDSNPPADASDSTITAKTWFTGSFTIDWDANGTADNSVNFSLTDGNSDGLFETMDLSTDDGTFGEGGTLTNAVTGNNDDERLSASGDVRLGAFYTFTAAFDSNPPADTSDAAITSKTWARNSFTLDTDADGAADDLANFVLSDTDSNGLFETIDLSTDDTIFGEGSLSDGVTGTDQDERRTSAANIRLGDYYTFTVAFDVNPASDTTDASVTSFTWFTGTFSIDADGDGAADDTVNFSLADANSNGVYDTMDLSTDDATFGEGTTLANAITGANDDERLTAAGDVRLGAFYTFAVGFDANPPADATDATLTSKTWYTASALLDLDADAAVDDTPQPDPQRHRLQRCLRYVGPVHG